MNILVSNKSEPSLADFGFDTAKRRKDEIRLPITYFLLTTPPQPLEQNSHGHELEWIQVASAEVERDEHTFVFQCGLPGNEPTPHGY